MNQSIKKIVLWIIIAIFGFIIFSTIFAFVGVQIRYSMNQSVLNQLNPDNAALPAMQVKFGLYEIIRFVVYAVFTYFVGTKIYKVIKEFTNEKN